MKWREHVWLLRMMLWVAVLVAAFHPRPAHGQEIGTFPLDEPIEDTVYACSDKGAAMELFSAFQEFESAAAEKKRAELASMQFELFRMQVANKCGMVSDTITYRALLESYTAKDGMYYTVYEAEMGESGQTIYVLLVNWKHFRVEV